MSKLIAATLALGALFAAPAFAGDAAKGEDVFKKCKSCHAITAPDGTDIVKGGKVGPNLYGVIGRQIGTAEGFKYGEGTIAAGADGTKWDEAMIAAYVVDPSKWLEEKTGDAALKSKMTFKRATGGEDVAAYLASVVAK